jgi:hypothetical protein
MGGKSGWNGGFLKNKPSKYTGWVIPENYRKE